MQLILPALLSSVFARETNIVKIPCNAEVKECLNINQQEMHLARIDAANFHELIVTLKCCNVKRARVGGYMGTITPMVLYDNGAVAPPVPYDPVEYALYVLKCECDYKVVCGYSTDGFKTCKYYEVCYDYSGGCNDVCAPVCPPNPCPPVCPPNPCPPVCPPDVCPPNPCTPVCPPAVGSCPYFAQKSKVCVTTPTGKRYSEISTAKTFVYPSGFSASNPIVNVYGQATVSSVETVDLRMRNASIPQIIYDRASLYSLKQQLECKFGTCVCLFVDCNSCVYFYVNGCLYKVTFVRTDGSQGVNYSAVTESELAAATKKGLFVVEFGC